MANPQIDPLMHALMWTALPAIFVMGVAGLLLREVLQWLGRKAKGVGRARRDGEVRRSQTDATGRRRTFTPASSSPPLSPPRPRATPPPLPPALELTLEDITWENFELLAGEIFRRKEFEVQISSGLGADGGKDLTLCRDGEVRLVQCKFLSAENKVSVMAMREFYGLVVAENAKRGIFMTTGLYSRDAKEFAEGKPIKLLDRADIERLIASVSRPGENLCNVRNWIDDFAATANVVDPNCPRCRKPMKLRRGVTGQAFWGCSSFPRCRGKRHARIELVRAFSYQGS